MKILVTGGSGFIGSHLVRRLKHDGHDVEIYESPTRRDIRDLGYVLQAAEGKDVIFHLAGNSSSPVAEIEPGLDITTNIQGTVNVLQAAEKYGCRVIFASSGYVSKLTMNYSISKFAGELYCDKYAEGKAVQACVARLMNVYGQGQRLGFIVPDLILKVKAHPRVLEMRGTGYERRDFIHVTDVVDALIFLSQVGKPLIRYQVGTGKTTSTRKLLGTLMDVAGYRIPARFEKKSEPGKLSTSTMVTDTETLNRLGWNARISLRDGLERTYYD